MREFYPDATNEPCPRVGFDVRPTGAVHSRIMNAYILTFGAFLLLGSPTQQQEAQMRSDIEVGRTLPDYELPDQDGAQRRLSHPQRGRAGFRR